MGTETTEYAPTDYMIPTLVTAEDKKRANKQAWGEYGTAALGSGLAGAAQIGLNYIPTASDTKNAEELSRLQDLESKNKLGLGSDVKAEYEHALLNPVRAAVGASERAESARLAASGRGSAADVVRTQRVAQDRMTDAAIRAGTQIEEANIAERQRQKQEIEERLASASAKDKQAIELAAQSITGLATNLAKVSAADPSKSRITDGQLMQMAAATDAKGRPMYPGLRGVSLNDARALVEAGDTATIFGQGKRDAQTEQRATEGSINPNAKSEGG